MSEGNEFLVEDEYEREECEYCTRKFHVDRIDKHRTVC